MKRTVTLLLCLMVIACGCQKTKNMPGQPTATDIAKPSQQQADSNSAVPAPQEQTSSPSTVPPSAEMPAPSATTQTSETAPTGRITSPVNLVGTGEWNSIILHAKSSPEVQGGTYRWEIVTDSTHVDRGNLKQGGNPQNTMIESEANWVEFTAESLSTALNDVMIKVSYWTPTGGKVWEDGVAFTTADIRFLLYCPDPGIPADGLDMRSLDIPVHWDEVSTSRPDSQEDYFFRLVVGLSNSIATPLLSGGAEVCLKVGSIEESGDQLDSSIYFSETPDLETIHTGLPIYSLPYVTYFATVHEIGAISLCTTDVADIPSALLDTAPPPPGYSARNYIVLGTLRPFLSLHMPRPGPICGGVVGGGIPWYGIVLICVVIGGCLGVFIYIGFIRRKR